MQDTVVVGCGGGGSKTVERLDELSDLPTITVNTGANDPTVAMSRTDIRDCRGDPELGWALATDYLDDIREKIKSYGNVVITAGLGGGTGSGAVPVISKCAKDNGSQVTTIVTLPMGYEKERRTRAVAQMREIVDSSDRTVLFDMDRIQEQMSSFVFNEALVATNNLVCKAIMNIAYLMNGPFRSVLSERIYTISYAESLNIVNDAVRSLELAFFDCDPLYGKSVICGESVLSKEDKGAIIEEIGNKTGIIPEVISGKKEEGNGVMTFIPISYRTLLS